MNIKTNEPLPIGQPVSVKNWHHEDMPDAAKNGAVGTITSRQASNEDKPGGPDGPWWYGVSWTKPGSQENPDEYMFDYDELVIW